MMLFENVDRVGLAIEARTTESKQILVRGFADFTFGAQDWQALSRLPKVGASIETKLDILLTELQQRFNRGDADVRQTLLNNLSQVIGELDQRWPSTIHQHQPYWLFVTYDRLILTRQQLLAAQDQPTNDR